MQRNNNTAPASGGIGFLGLLFLVFLVLKLTHVIAWSWWWVTAPLWGPFVVLAAGFLIAGLVIAVLFLYKLTPFSRRRAERRAELVREQRRHWRR